MGPLEYLRIKNIPWQLKEKKVVSDLHLPSSSFTLSLFCPWRSFMRLGRLVSKNVVTEEIADGPALMRLVLVPLTKSRIPQFVIP